jgi:membrane protein required for colicin V production
MTVFDYVVIAIVVASLALGVWRGVVGEVVALLAWVLAFLAARHFGDEFAARFLTTHISDAGLRVAAGWLAVFVGVLILMALIRLAASSFIKAVGLGLSDRLLGLFFGLARGLMIVVVLVAVGGMTSLPKHPWWVQASLAPPLETAVLAAKPWLPDEMAKRIRFR